MRSFLIRRLITMVVVFLIITVLLFTLVHLAPGDPIAQMIPIESYNQGTQALIEQLRHEYGLDRPIPVQYLNWLSNALHGDLGYSITARSSVSSVIASRLTPTIELMGVSITIGVALSIPLGVVAAVRQNGIIDYIATAISVIVMSTPSFFIGIIGIYIFSLKLRLLPSAGMSTTGVGGGGMADLLQHMVLPVSILALGVMGPITRYVRGSVLSELNSEYVRTGLAKGLSMTKILFKHVLRNAMIPIITVVALYIPSLLSGAVVIEQIFSWPGMGQMALAATVGSDYSLIIAFALMVSILVLLANLLADVLYAVADPRVVLK